MLNGILEMGDPEETATQGLLSGNQLRHFLYQTLEVLPETSMRVYGISFCMVYVLVSRGNLDDFQQCATSTSQLPTETNTVR